MSIISKLPKDEVAKVGYYNTDGEKKFVLTSKDSFFYLYKVGDGFEKLGRAKEPTELIEKFGVWKALV